MTKTQREQEIAPRVLAHSGAVVQARVGHLDKSSLSGVATEGPGVYGATASIGGIVSVIKSRYDSRVLALKKVYDEKNQGAVRSATGKVFEHFVDDVVESLGSGYSVKDGTSDKIISSFGGHRRGVQVDRHIFLNGRRTAFVECKTYLDAAYMQRFVLNVIEIVHALGPANVKGVKFAVLAGQDAIATETLVYLRAMAAERAGVEVEVFFVNAVKRTSTNPIYAGCFPLLENSTAAFVKFLKDRA